MKAGILTIVCAAALLAASGARAQNGNADNAQAHFDRGAKLYNLGHFQDAIGDFEKAYDLDPSPIFLFNIAQSHRQLGNKERALFFYRRYLEQAPKAANREDVERRIKDLQASVQQEAEAKQKPPTDVAPHVDTREHDAPNEEAAPSEPAPGTDVAPPPVAADDRRAWQVAVGLAPAFPTLSGSPVKAPPSMFAARLEGGYGIALPAGELARGRGYRVRAAAVPAQGNDRAPDARGDQRHLRILGGARVRAVSLRRHAVAEAGRRRRGRVRLLVRSRRRQPVHDWLRGNDRSDRDAQRRRTAARRAAAGRAASSSR